MFIYSETFEEFASVECRFVFTVVYLDCWSLCAILTFCNYVSYDSDVKLLPSINMFETKSGPSSRARMALGARCWRSHAKPTWHFGRISSHRSSAPPGPPENTDPACFPSSGLQTEPNKICCRVLPRGPSLNVIPTTTNTTTAVRLSSKPAVTVPEFTGAFPAGLDGYFHSTVLHPHTSYPWEPLSLASAQKHFV